MPMSDAVERAQHDLAREIARERDLPEGDPRARLVATARMESELREVGLQEAVDEARQSSPPLTWTEIAEALGLASAGAAAARFGPGAAANRARAAERSASRSAIAADAIADRPKPDLPGWSLAEAADELDITLAAARVRLARARKAARESGMEAELEARIERVSGGVGRAGVRLLDLDVLRTGSQPAHS